MADFDAVKTVDATRVNFAELAQKLDHAKFSGGKASIESITSPVEIIAGLAERNGLLENAAWSPLSISEKWIGKYPAGFTPYIQEVAENKATIRQLEATMAQSGELQPREAALGGNQHLPNEKANSGAFRS